jgi:hypothetical protein
MDLFLAREISHESLPKLEALPENQLRHELGDRIIEVLLDLFTHGEGTSTHHYHLLLLLTSTFIFSIPTSLNLTL